MYNQFDANYKSSVVFLDDLLKLLKPVKAEYNTKSAFNITHMLRADCLETPLGLMLAIGDAESLYFLSFVDQLDIPQTVIKLKQNYSAEITLGSTPPIKSIALELQSYFDGDLRQFKTPLHITGTQFQKTVWNETIKIPYGHTSSYIEQAKAIGKDKAYRAVANANAANKIVIAVPCHRIIRNNGELGGYSCGIKYKQLLLAHEKKHLPI